MYAVHRKVVYSPSARFRSNSEGTRLVVLCAEHVVTTVNQYAIGEGSPACVGDSLMSGHTPQPPGQRTREEKTGRAPMKPGSCEGCGRPSKGTGGEGQGTRLHPLGQETKGGTQGVRT